MPELITVPTFQFDQGEVLIEDAAEWPLNVRYHENKRVTLEQNGNEVLISLKYLDALVKEIKKHLPAAETKLNKK